MTRNLMSLCIAVIILSITKPALAQVKLGIRGGLNISNMLSKDKDRTYSTDFYLKSGFNLGVTTDFSISEKFALESGLLFSTKGYQAESFGIKRIINLNYLGIPIHAAYKINLGGTKLAIYAGPYVGYAISGKMRTNKAVLGENGNSKEEKIKIGTDKLKDELRPFDWGLNIGTAIEVKHFTIGIQYGFGLANISVYRDNDAKVANRVFSILVGYKFGKE